MREVLQTALRAGLVHLCLLVSIYTHFPDVSTMLMKHDFGSSMQNVLDRAFRLEPSYL